MTDTPAVPEDRTAALHRGLRQHPAELFQFDPRMCSGWLSDRCHTGPTVWITHRAGSL